MHSGRDKCWARINARFYWHGGHAYVKKMTKECVHCLQKNHQIYRADVAPLIPIPVTPKVMWRIHCDLMGPFTTTQSGNKYVALAICAFTKYLEGMGNFYFSYSLFFHSNAASFSKFINPFGLCYQFLLTPVFLLGQI